MSCVYLFVDLFVGAFAVSLHMPFDLGRRIEKSHHHDDWGKPWLKRPANPSVHVAFCFFLSSFLLRPPPPIFVRFSFPVRFISHLRTIVANNGALLVVVFLFHWYLYSPSLFYDSRSSFIRVAVEWPTTGNDDRSMIALGKENARERERTRESSLLWLTTRTEIKQSRISLTLLFFFVKDLFFIIIKARPIDTGPISSSFQRPFLTCSVSYSKYMYTHTLYFPAFVMEQYCTLTRLQAEHDGFQIGPVGA